MRLCVQRILRECGVCASYARTLYKYIVRGTRLYFLRTKASSQRASARGRGHGQKKAKEKTLSMCTYMLCLTLSHKKDSLEKGALTGAQYYREVSSLHVVSQITYDMSHMCI